MTKKSRIQSFVLYLAVCLAFSVAAAMGTRAQQQSDPTHVSDPGFLASAFYSNLTAPSANVYVSVRESTGMPVEARATVKLSCPLVGVDTSGVVEGTNAQIQFHNVPAGDCIVVVSAPGYKTSRDRTEVLQSVTVRNQYVYVYLHSESENAATATRPAVVPLGLMKEIDKAMEAMQKNREGEARKHLLKANQIAPANGDVAYLQGMVEMEHHNLPVAEQYFQKAANSSRAQERVLVSLGQVQVESKEYPAAVETLEKALQVNTASPRAHLLLANAYAQLHNFPKAQEHAQRAEEFGSENAAPARTLLAEILAAEGNKDAAKIEYQAVLKEFPSAASAAVAKEQLEKLNAPGSGAAGDLNAATTAPMAGKEEALLPAMSAASVTAWAPSNVDTSMPAVASDISCSAEDVVQRTGISTDRQLENLEKFMATEHIQHEEVNKRGVVTQIRDKNFYYMVFIEHSKDVLVILDEKRDGATGTDSFPTSLATVGLVSLGVDVFHPGFAKALNFKCEGLGQWRGKAAWVLHFEQKPGEKSFLRIWQTKLKTVEVPLKGRVWVAASNYNVLHVESDLREPMKDLELMRDHLAIDYGPVNFQNGKTELWVPWYADMYLELHGRRYHHNHTLTDFKLFAEDTRDKIA